MFEETWKAVLPVDTRDLACNRLPEAVLRYSMQASCATTDADVIQANNTLDELIQMKENLEDEMTKCLRCLLEKMNVVGNIYSEAMIDFRSGNVHFIVNYEGNRWINGKASIIRNSIFSLPLYFLFLEEGRQKETLQLWARIEDQVLPFTKETALPHVLKWVEIIRRASEKQIAWTDEHIFKVYECPDFILLVKEAMNIENVKDQKELAHKVSFALATYVLNLWNDLPEDLQCEQEFANEYCSTVPYPLPPGYSVRYEGELYIIKEYLGWDGAHVYSIGGMYGDVRVSEQELEIAGEKC